MSRWSALILLSVAVLLGMALWCGVCSAAPQRAREWHVSANRTAWLTLAVQLGFVAGTLASALFNLPDIIRARHLFALCAFSGAAVNALLAWTAHAIGPAIALRLLTGMFLAGVYPPAMKIIATWFRTSRGFALGVLIGALTLGKASPYLVNAIGSSSWRVNVAWTSIFAVIGGALVLILRDGPYALPNQPFDITQITSVFRNRGVRPANFGYFGHMWELYAMWTWAPAMFRAAITPRLAEAGSFIVIGSGAVGCIVAGLLADRIGRTVAASAAMAISGACCLAIGFLYGRSEYALLAIAIVWGASGRRLGAVLRVRHGARRSALHRHCAHPADEHRLSDHHAYHSPLADAGRCRRMALRIRRAGARTIPRNHRDAAPAIASGGQTARGRTGVSVADRKSLHFRTSPSCCGRRAGICFVAAPQRCHHIACVAAPRICRLGARNESKGIFDPLR